MGRDGGDDPEFDRPAARVMAAEDDRADAPRSGGLGGPIRYRVFRSSFSSWDSLLEEAAAFANEVGSERVISIAHSADHSEGVVVVWYREGE